MLKSLITALALTFTASAASEYAASGSSSVRVEKTSEGSTALTTTNTAFEIADWFDGETLKPLLVKTVLERTRYEMAEGISGRLAVEVRGTSSKRFDHVLWKTNDDSDSFALNNDLVLVSKSGCCGSLTTYRAHDLRTGRMIVAYDENTGHPENGLVTPFIIDVPNAQPAITRFIGVLTADATRDFQQDRTATQAKVATVTYADRQRVLKSFDVYAIVPDGWAASVESSLMDTSASKKNELSANRLTLWSSDGVSQPSQAVNSFSLKISIVLENTLDVVIPFVNDQPDFAHADVATGVRLVPR